MPRKTKIRKGKRRSGTRSKRSTRRSNRSRSYKSRRYRGGCENDSCALSGSMPSKAPLWTSSGGGILPEQISNDIYGYGTDPKFYSASK